MTAYQLQKDLGKEVEEILRDILLKDENGGMTHLKSYLQKLPKRMQEVAEGDVMQGEVEDADLYPYCLVMLESGKLETAESAHKIKTALVFGIFDDDLQCSGDQVILNMIHKITERFTKNPVLKDKYRMNEAEGISWVLDDEDRYPYYFGMMEMYWDTFFVRREDKYV